MLPLISERWQDLQHAYGSASDIPALLTALETLPPTNDPDAEPYFSLWSALCHQGDVYTASYAAVPHFVRVIATAPERAGWILFQLVACIEIARLQGRGPIVPSDLQDAYRQALDQIPKLVADVHKPWDEVWCRCLLSAIAASKGFADLADAVQELDPPTIEALLQQKFGGDYGRRDPCSRSGGAELGGGRMT